MKFYRFECRNSEVGVQIELITYSLIRETKAGYWIGYLIGGRHICPKLIPKKSLKRFAYPTKKEALTNYVKRSEKRVRILNSQLQTTELGILRAKDIYV
jgi:hypothetical protein